MILLLLSLILVMATCVKMADTDDALNQHAFGIALEAAASGDIVDVQVEGICDIAQVVAALSDSDEGKMLAASAQKVSFPLQMKMGQMEVVSLLPALFSLNMEQELLQTASVYLLNILKM